MCLVSIQATMPDSSQATRPGEIWIGRGARWSRIIRHQVVRLIPILGCRVRQDNSREFAVLIITFSFEPVCGAARSGCDEG